MLGARTGGWGARTPLDPRSLWSTSTRRRRSEQGEEGKGWGTRRPPVGGGEGWWARCGHPRRGEMARPLGRGSPGPLRPRGLPAHALPALSHRVWVSGQGPAADSAPPASWAQSSRRLGGISSCFYPLAQTQPLPGPSGFAPGGGPPAVRAGPCSPPATGPIWLLRWGRAHAGPCVCLRRRGRLPGLL